MSFYSTPYLLRNLPSLTSALVRSVYTYLAATVNGALDFRNFQRKAGIPQALKSQPNSIVSVRVPLYGSGTFKWALPPGLQAGSPTVTCIGWSFSGSVWTTEDNGINSGGTVTLKDYLGVTIDGPASYANPSTAGYTGFFRALGTDIGQRGTIVVTAGTGGTLKTCYVDLWLKTAHVK